MLPTHRKRDKFTFHIYRKNAIHLKRYSPLVEMCVTIKGLVTPDPCILFSQQLLCFIIPSRKATGDMEKVSARPSVNPFVRLPSVPSFCPELNLKTIKVLIWNLKNELIVTRRSVVTKKRNSTSIVQLFYYLPLFNLKKIIV